jgi:hypothetical protein
MSDTQPVTLPNPPQIIYHADARPSGERGISCGAPDIGLVADVSVVHPGAATSMRAATQIHVAAAASPHAEQRAKYGVGAGCFAPLSTERYGRMGSQARKFLRSLATAGVSSAAAGSQVMMSAFRAGALREFCEAPIIGMQCRLCYCKRHRCHTCRGCANK